MSLFIYLFICIYNFNLYLDFTYTKIVCIQTSLWTNLPLGLKPFEECMNILFIIYIYIYIYIIIIIIIIIFFLSNSPFLRLFLALDKILAVWLSQL